MPDTPQVGEFWKHRTLKHTVEIVRTWVDSVEFDFKGYSQVYLMEDFIAEFEKVSVDRML